MTHPKIRIPGTAVPAARNARVSRIAVLAEKTQPAPASEIA
jgi:hypothetical protein